MAANRRSDSDGSGVEEKAFKISGFHLGNTLSIFPNQSSVEDTAMAAEKRRKKDSMRPKHKHTHTHQLSFIFCITVDTLGLSSCQLWGMLNLSLWAHIAVKLRGFAPTRWKQIVSPFGKHFTLNDTHFCHCVLLCRYLRRLYFLAIFKRRRMLHWLIVPKAQLCGVFCAKSSRKQPPHHVKSVGRASVCLHALVRTYVC